MGLATDPLLESLRRHFGWEAFRPGQREVVEALLAGRDCLAVLPTGAGKSLCYQLPALVREGLVLVISPLVALMQDQVEQLRRRGIAAACLHAGLEGGERRRLLRMLQEQRLRRSIQINGVSGLCITKLDVLDGLEEIQLCVGYDSPSGRRDVLPFGADAVAGCTPIYESWKGWSGTTAGVKRWDALPQAAQAYLKRLSEVTGAPIAMVSTGPERDETILLEHPFGG